jgi:hypothetical protein
MFDWDKFDEIYIYFLIGLLGVPLIFYTYTYLSYKTNLLLLILSIVLCIIFIGCIIGYKKGGNKVILGEVLIGISIVGGILLSDSLYKLVNKNNNSNYSLSSDENSIKSEYDFRYSDKFIYDGRKSPYDN